MGSSSSGEGCNAGRASDPRSESGRESAAPSGRGRRGDSWREFPWSLVVAVAALGIFVGRAQVLGALSPFGLAYIAACFAWRRDLTGCALVAVTFGRGWLLGIEAAAIEAATGIVFWLSAELAAGGRRADDGAHSRIICAAAGASAAVGAIAVLPGGGAPYDLYLLFFEVLLVASSTAVFVGTLPRLLMRGLTVGDRVDPSAATAAGIVGGVFLLGTEGLQVSGLHLSWVVALFILFLFSAGGLWSGIGAGAAVGLTFGVAVEFDPSLALVFTGAGAVAGFLARYGRPAAAAGFAAGFVLLGATSGPSALPGPWEVLISLGLYLLYPFEKQPPSAEIAATADGEMNAGGNEGVRAMLGRFAAREGSGPEREDGAAERLGSFARAFRRLAQSFSESTEGEDVVAGERDRAAELLDEIGARVCTACDSYSECWQKGFLGTYHLFSEMLACFEVASGDGLQKRIQQLRRRCGERADEVLAVARSGWQIQRLGVKWASQVAETRDLAAAQLRGLADVLEDFAAAGRPTGRGSENSEEKRLRYEAGVAQVAQGGSEASGDSHLIRRLNGTELVVLLSDGMGSGPRARRESRAALSLLEELMQLGIDRDVALRTVNSVLLLRSSEDTPATVDMMSVDLLRGEARFTKIGAAPTFIRRHEEVFCIPRQAVPIGILNDLPLETTEKRLRPGDVVVMVTDGVLDALGSLTETEKRRWIRRFLRSERFGDPEELATSLVARAASLSAESFPDDMSAIAIELRDPE